MIEPNEIPLILSILAVLTGLWALIKSFQTSRIVNGHSKRLSANRKMVEASHELSKRTYNRVKQVEASLLAFENFDDDSDADEASDDGEPDDNTESADDETEQIVASRPAFRQRY